MIIIRSQAVRSRQACLQATRQEETYIHMIFIHRQKDQDRHMPAGMSTSKQAEQPEIPAEFV
jgi:uncharacterized membrane protein YccC